MSSEFPNEWGIFPVFPQSAVGRVHPEDLSRYATLVSNHRVFRLLGNEDGWRIIQYADSTFRVRPDEIRLVSAPLYNIGETVYIVGKNAAGKIKDIYWHFKDERPMYFLEIDNKLQRRRYYDTDLAKAN
jgi:hypothetical protein